MNPNSKLTGPLETTGNEGGVYQLLLTIPQVADALAVSRRSIWRLLSTGELASVKVGRACRITAESVKAFVSRGGAA